MSSIASQPVPIFAADEFFQAYMACSPDCVKILDLQGRIQVMNPQGCRLMELPDGETALGRPWVSFWAAERAALIQETLAAALAGETRRFTAPCATFGGATRHWDVIVAPLRRDGQVSALLVTSRDVTDLVTARIAAEARELALERKAASLALAGVIAKVGGWRMDCRTGEMSWSDEVWAMLGAPRRELTFDEALAVYAPEDHPRIQALFEHAHRTGERITFETRARRADGEAVWVRVFGEPEFQDGVCVGLRGAAQDITDIKLALESSQRAEQQLGVALRIAKIHVYELDFVRGGLTVHGADATMFQDRLSFEEAKDPFALVHPDDRPGAVAAWKRSMQSGEPFWYEHRVNRADREVWAFSVAELVSDSDGRPVRLVGALQDITERKRIEFELRRARDQAEAANQAKTAFLANMSHEIRTPLNGVLGMAQVMARDDLSAAQRERLRVIRESGETLMAVLNDVLDISKIEAGRFELDAHDFDLDDAVRAACRPFAALASQKDLTFEIEVDPAAGGTWRGDGVRLRQVLGNLVSNAVKFTSHGEVSVSVRRRPGGLAFQVRDSGIGIAPKLAAAVFEKFAQGDTSTSRRYGGTGLGLPISRELVRLMGGELTLASVPDRGSVFSFALPLEPRPSAARRPDDAPLDLEAEATDRPLRILAAEDNPTNQVILRALLEPAGVDLQVAPDGQAAVDAAAGAEFDLILMDVQMPRLSGVEATREIRSREAREGGRRTPILALSANVMTHQVEEYLQAGMDGFIAKPIDAAKLFEAIETGVAAAQAGRAA